MRSKRRAFSLFGLPSLGLVLFFFLPPPRMAPSVALQPTPLWWEIVLDLKTNGDYKLEGNDSTYQGTYRFAVCWTGCLEKDDHDYLLYLFDSRLTDWMAQEIASSPEATRILTASDFKEKPSLNLKYILRRDSDLLLDFLVQGMVVPQKDAEEGFNLLLPSSQENDQHDFQVNYNTYVVKGSNSVSLKESEIYAGPVTKNYAWTWKHQQWQLRQQQTVFTAQSHRAEVSLSIIPHYTRPK